MCTVMMQQSLVSQFKNLGKFNKKHKFLVKHLKVLSSVYHFYKEHSQTACRESLLLHFITQNSLFLDKHTDVQYCSLFTIYSSMFTHFSEQYFSGCCWVLMAAAVRVDVDLVVPVWTPSQQEHLFHKAVVSNVFTS